MKLAIKHILEFQKSNGLFIVNGRTEISARHMPTQPEEVVAMADGTVKETGKRPLWPWKQSRRSSFEHMSTFEKELCAELIQE